MDASIGFVILALAFLLFIGWSIRFVRRQMDYSNMTWAQVIAWSIFAILAMLSAFYMLRPR